MFPIVRAILALIILLLLTVTTSILALPGGNRDKPLPALPAEPEATVHQIDGVQVLRGRVGPAKLVKIPPTRPVVRKAKTWKVRV